VSLPLSRIVEIAESAGCLILGHYASAQVEKQLKEDQSPLTAADMASHDFIVSALQAASPWPALSEESAAASYETRSGWQQFWLVDPLDGTREFLKRNGEFTVNIALIDHGLPVMGVVHAPARALTYFAARGQGAFLKEGAGKAQRIPRGIPCGERLAVVISRSHADAETAAFLATLGEYDSVSVGSSLKFCLLAEGRAQLYPRFGPTMEWDTAAGQCVLEEAGGSVCDLERRPLTYNKCDLQNPFFIARALVAGGCESQAAWRRREEIGL
jgi:3'(2'), 5'-bisphosphate nucleotidase